MNDAGETVTNDFANFEVTATFKNGYSRVLSQSEYSITPLYYSEYDEKDLEGGLHENNELTFSARTQRLRISSGKKDSDNYYAQEFDIVLNADTPVIESQTNEQKKHTFESKPSAIDVNAVTLVTSHASVEGEHLTTRWYRSTSSDMTDKVLIYSGTTETIETSDYPVEVNYNDFDEEKGTTYYLPLSTTVDGETVYYYYQAEITNTNTFVNGTQSAKVTSSVFGGKVTSISASYASGKYVTVNAENTETGTKFALPEIGDFTIIKTYSDGKTVTEKATDGLYSREVALDSTYSKYLVGNIPVKVTLNSDTSISTTINVPYKYTIATPAASVSVSESTGASTDSPAIAQYTGSLKLNTESLESSTVYSLYNSDGSTTEITHSYEYAWYSNKTGLTSGGDLIEVETSTEYSITNPTATGTTYYYYTVTATSSEGDWATATSSTAESTKVTVQGYSLTITNSTIQSETYTHGNGGSRTLTKSGNYNLTLVNTADKDLSTRKFVWSKVADGSTAITLDGDDDNLYYTNVVNMPNGTDDAKIQVKLNESDTTPLISVTINISALTLTGIQASLVNSSYYISATAATLPTLDKFKVIRSYLDTFVSPSTTVTTTDSYATSDSYTMTCSPTAWTANNVGDMTVTITDTTVTTASSEVIVPYKYTLASPTVSITSTETITDNKISIAQNSEASLTCNATPVATYSLYNAEGEPTAISDTITYQWYSSTSSTTTGGTEISDATSADYTLPNSTTGTFYYYCVATISASETSSSYCTNTSASKTSEVITVTVTSE